MHVGEVFKKAKPEIQNPVTLRALIVDLIEPEKWMSMQADVKGDIYEGLLSKSAAESPKGAGQYFTPRELIKAIVDCARPTAADTLCDPACGTGGFLLNAYDYVVRHQGKDLDPDQKKHLKRGFVKGWELVPNTAADSLPEPDVFAQEIADDLQTAMELFATIANELKE